MMSRGRGLARGSGGAISAAVLAGAVLSPLRAAVADVAGAGQVSLGALDLARVRQGWGKAQADRSVTETPLSIAGERFDTGVGTHARSVILVELGGAATRFRALCGVDDNAGAGRGSVQFSVAVDGKRVWRGPVMKCGDKPERVDVDLSGAKMVALVASDGGDGISYDHADWAEAFFEASGPGIEIALARPEEAVILTPPPPREPRINGPRVYGCRPARPFLYRIPVTGARPVVFSAAGLPEGLRLDPATGIITGAVPEAGEHAVELGARNAHGTASRRFTIRCGAKLALTPPMGWNHWYAHYDRITDAMMREAADAMVASGMADVGYQYVNIDDCWANAPQNRDPLRVGPLRDERGEILPNRHFPDMKALTDYIHARGLKAGIYTSPGPLTCAGFAGSLDHEAQDAARFAAWGFDFLKYDWCSYGQIAKGDSREELQKPYRLMGAILREQPRDMVLNLCQYGMGDVWEWGASVGGHSWRTGGDLGFELDRVFEVALRNVAIGAFNKPGEWNDPDYIQIGYIGTASVMGELRPCGMTPSEQYAFMSLWCLMAAPLFYSGDMSRLDAFTLSVLCNPEVIEVDQDPLGRCARALILDEGRFLLAKEMEDGSLAVGLFNRDEWERMVGANWAGLDRSGPQRVRDLWRQAELGIHESGFSTLVPPRGAAMIRLWPAEP